MPNHVLNIVTFHCGEKKLRGILDRICVSDEKRDDRGIGTIDFERIIPMPESLRIEDGSRTRDAINMVLSAMNENNEYSHPLVNDFIGGNPKSSKFVEQFSAEMAAFGSHCVADGNASKEDIKRYLKYDDEEKLIKLGIQAIMNYLQYRCISWYDWSIANWGTKWNAYDFADYSGGNSIGFYTAWNAPVPVISKLSEMYPDVLITHNYADEDIGYNCGCIEYKGGEIITDNTDMPYDEARKFANSLWGWSDEDEPYAPGPSLV